MEVDYRLADLKRHIGVGLEIAKANLDVQFPEPRQNDVACRLQLYLDVVCLFECPDAIKQFR